MSGALSSCSIFFVDVDREHIGAEFFEAFADGGGVGKFVEAIVPGVLDPFTVDDRRVEGIDRKHRETDFARQLFA